MKNILSLLAIMFLSSCGGGSSSNDSTTPKGNTGNSNLQITITPSTPTYVYDGTIPTQPTATISGSTNTTKITITGNISKNVGAYVLTYTATDLISNKQIRQTATITITPKPITITADAVSKLQGTTNNPSLSDDRLTKLFSGDILTGTLGSIGLSTSTAGTYDITSTLSNSNYDITFVGKDKFSINSKPQIILASKTVSYVYGEAAIKPTATITSNSTTTDIVITGNIDKNVGTYLLTYSATDSAGNAAIPQIARIFITPKPITVTANPATKVYGTANPSFTYVITGGLESSDTLSGSLSSSAVSVGTHDIISTLSNNNYAITFVGENKFSITAKPADNTDNTKPQITLTSNTVSYVYGEAAIKPTATITDNSTTTGITITGNIGSDVGTYVLTYNTTDSAGNTAIPQIATVTITPKPITITADVKSKVYGTANPSFTYVITGGLESSDTLSGSLSSSAVSVGTHDIISTLSNNNYAITFVGDDKFSITPIPADNTDNIKPQITLASNTVSYVYGEVAIKPTATITDNSTTTGITITGNIGSDVGTYVLTYNTTDSAGNTAIPQIATVTITPKPVTITANVVTKVYGTANPSFGYVSVGLVGGDSLAGTLSVSVSNNADVGSYDIISTLSNNNYDITFIGENKFIITKASQSAFSVGNNQDKTFVSGAISGTTFTITTTGTLSINQATYNTSNANIATIDANGVITLKAAGTVTIGATSTADNNYNAAYGSFTLTIYPSTTTLADVTATISGIQLAWSAVVGSGISYKVYYATKTIVGHNNLAANYHNLAVSLIDNLTTTATTVLNLKRNVVYHFVVTVAQNNVESVISNEVTSTLKNPLNDTGLTWAGNNPTGNNSTCTSNITSPQDCHQGRDAKAALAL